MGDVITLSSDEDEQLRKKFKPNPKKDPSEEQNGSTATYDEDIKVKLSKKDNVEDDDPLKRSNDENNSNAEESTTDAELEDPTSEEKRENGEPPLSAQSSQALELFNKFLSISQDSIKDSKYEDRISIKYSKLRSIVEANIDYLIEDKMFEVNLSKNLETAKLSASHAVVSFRNFYFYVKDVIDNTDGVNMDENTKIKLRKLEKAINRLRKFLKKLDEAEVDLDDETDSAYLRQEYYAKKLSKCYEKQCEILNRHAKAGLLTHTKLKFTFSKHAQINNALTKSYRHDTFPSYYQVEKIIRKCNEKHDLKLSDSEIKTESKFCFEKIGNVLQCRRKTELYNMHSQFISNQEDPAKKDEELRMKLKKNYESGKKKIAQVFETFVLKQNNKEEVALSEDSDDSHVDEDSSSSE